MERVDQNMLVYHSFIKLSVIIYPKENKFLDHSKPSVIPVEKEGRRKGKEKEKIKTIYWVNRENCNN